MLPAIASVAPPDIVSALPSNQSIAILAKTAPSIVRSRFTLARAAWNRPSVLPATVNRFYRFGPPDVIAGPAGSTLPYWWLYVADELMTGIYEAGFCGHDARKPGRFFIHDAAVKNGLLAQLKFPSPLRLLDLPRHAFTMGIHDKLSSPDHAWCQWFAYQLQAAGLFDTPGGAFDGLLYPSRKRRGVNAIALASTYVDAARPRISSATRAFRTSKEYRQLWADPFRIDAP